METNKVLKGTLTISTSLLMALSQVAPVTNMAVYANEVTTYAETELVKMDLNQTSPTKEGTVTASSLSPFVGDGDKIEASFDNDYNTYTNSDYSKNIQTNTYTITLNKEETISKVRVRPRSLGQTPPETYTISVTDNNGTTTVAASGSFVQQLGPDGFFADIEFNESHKAKTITITLATTTSPCVATTEVEIYKVDSQEIVVDKTELKELIDYVENDLMEKYSGYPRDLKYCFLTEKDVADIQYLYEDAVNVYNSSEDDQFVIDQTTERFKHALNLTYQHITDAITEMLIEANEANENFPGNSNLTRRIKTAQDVLDKVGSENQVNHYNAKSAYNNLAKATYQVLINGNYKKYGLEYFHNYTTESVKSFYAAWKAAGNANTNMEVEQLKAIYESLNPEKYELVDATGKTGLFVGIGENVKYDPSNGTQDSEHGIFSVKEEQVVVDGQDLIRLTIEFVNNGIHPISGIQRDPFFNLKDASKQIHRVDATTGVLTQSLTNAQPLDGDWNKGFVATIDVEPGEYEFTVSRSGSQTRRTYSAGIYRTNHVVVDKSALEEAIDKAEKLDETNYTEESWNAMQEALNQAKDVLANEEATVTEVEEATKALNDALEALVESIPWTDLEPSTPIEPDIPWTDLEPSTPVEKEETETPDTSDSSTIGLAFLMMLTGSILAYLTNKKRKENN